jgi:hypothetical protein
MGLEHESRQTTSAERGTSGGPPASEPANEPAPGAAAAALSHHFDAVSVGEITDRAATSGWQGLPSAPPVPRSTPLHGGWAERGRLSPPPADLGAPAQMKPGPGGPGGALPRLPDEPGQPLDPELRTRLEAELGVDLGAVRVHQGPVVSEMGALALTQGDHIWFAPGQLAPGTPAGNALLRHELGHVLQQRAGRVQPTGSIGDMPINDDPGLEAEADRLAASGLPRTAPRDGPAQADSDDTGTLKAMIALSAKTGLFFSQPVTGATLSPKPGSGPVDPALQHSVQAGLKDQQLVLLDRKLSKGANPSAEVAAGQAKVAEKIVGRVQDAIAADPEKAVAAVRKGPASGGGAGSAGDDLADVARGFIDAALVRWLAEQTPAPPVTTRPRRDAVIGRGPPTVDPPGETPDSPIDAPPELGHGGDGTGELQTPPEREDPPQLDGDSSEGQPQEQQEEDAPLVLTEDPPTDEEDFVPVAGRSTGHDEPPLQRDVGDEPSPLRPRQGSPPPKLAKHRAPEKTTPPPEKDNQGGSGGPSPGPKSTPVSPGGKTRLTPELSGAQVRALDWSSWTAQTNLPGAQLDLFTGMFLKANPPSGTPAGGKGALEQKARAHVAAWERLQDPAALDTWRLARPLLDKWSADALVAWLVDKASLGESLEQTEETPDSGGVKVSVALTLGPDRTDFDPGLRIELKGVQGGDPSSTSEEALGPARAALEGPNPLEVLARLGADPAEWTKKLLDDGGATAGLQRELERRISEALEAGTLLTLLGDNPKGDNPKGDNPKQEIPKLPVVKPEDVSDPLRIDAEEEDIPEVGPPDVPLVVDDPKTVDPPSEQPPSTTPLETEGLDREPVQRAERRPPVPEGDPVQAFSVRGGFDFSPGRAALPPSLAAAPVETGQERHHIVSDKSLLGLLEKRLAAAKEEAGADAERVTVEANAWARAALQAEVRRIDEVTAVIGTDAFEALPDTLQRKIQQAKGSRGDYAQLLGKFSQADDEAQPDLSDTEVNDQLLSALEWMPSNLVIGPQGRALDPKDMLDVEALSLHPDRATRTLLGQVALAMGQIDEEAIAAVSKALDEDGRERWAAFVEDARTQDPVALLAKLVDMHPGGQTGGMAPSTAKGGQKQTLTRPAWVKLLVGLVAG